MYLRPTKIRISGATPEEKERNKDIQAVGLLQGTNELVFFDVKDGEIRGVRVNGVMYARTRGVGEGIG
jgi:hypothetical protein